MDSEGYVFERGSGSLDYNMISIDVIYKIEDRRKKKRCKGQKEREEGALVCSVLMLTHAHVRACVFRDQNSSRLKSLPVGLSNNQDE